MTCATCIYHVQSWPLCTHPDSCDWSFWGDAMDYACHTPAKDVPEADFGKIVTIHFPIPAGATPGEQAP